MSVQIKTDVLVFCDECRAELVAYVHNGDEIYVELCVTCRDAAYQDGVLEGTENTEEPT